MALGLVLPKGWHFIVAAKVTFQCTNNTAEYKACILELRAAIEFKVRELEVFGDFMLIICQTLEEWKTKDSKTSLIPPANRGTL